MKRRVVRRTKKLMVFYLGVDQFDQLIIKEPDIRASPLWRIQRAASMLGARTSRSRLGVFYRLPFV